MQTTWWYSEGTVPLKISALLDRLKRITFSAICISLLCSQNLKLQTLSSLFFNLALEHFSLFDVYLLNLFKPTLPCWFFQTATVKNVSIFLDTRENMRMVESWNENWETWNFQFFPHRTLTQGMLFKSWEKAVNGETEKRLVPSLQCAVVSL